MVCKVKFALHPLIYYESVLFIIDVNFSIKNACAPTTNEHT